MIKKAQRAEKRRRQKLPAALLAVEIDVKQIARVELRLIPRAAVGNDAEAVQQFPVRMLGGLERDARRAVQLRNHDAFRAIDDKRALRRHQRQFAHENFFFLGALAFFLEQESDVERRAVGQALAQAFEPVNLRFADFVGIVSELAFAIVALDGKHLLKHGLEAGVGVALFGRGFRLQEFPVGIGLQFDHVRRRDDFLDLAEVDTFRGSRWHLFFLSCPRPRPSSSITTTRTTTTISFN